MSLLNMTLGRKKKLPDTQPAPFSGFILEENAAHDDKEALLHCLIKGLLIFSASFGCISGVLSEFDIACDYIALLVFILSASFFLSLIHLKKWLFNIGYPSLFVVFTFMLTRYRLPANSGFQALVNIVTEEYSTHFLMLFTRESTETITDRYFTITVAAVFLGVFLAILINVGIFNDMYFLTTYNLTFWPLMLGIYIGKYPSFFSMVLLFFAYFAIYFLKHSGHYRFIYPGKKGEYTKTWQRKGKHYVFYKSNARNMAQLCLFALIISLFFSVFGSASSAQSEAQAVKSGSIKNSVDTYVKIFVQNGLAGFFNRYQSTGGLSNGRLGGVSSVRPDYQPDLLVTFVPYAYETVYLKAFTGFEYTGSSWNSPDSTKLYQYPANTNLAEYNLFCAYTEGETLEQMMDASMIPPMKGRMIVKNLDAAPNAIYLPYYISPMSEHVSITHAGTIKGILLQEDSITLNYIPYSPSQTDLEDKLRSDFTSFKDETQNDYFSTYSSEVYDNYLQIPDEILPSLIDYHEEIGYDTSLAGQISLIRRFLAANYEYDMSPGTTPRNEDFVTYFLGTQKKGYCSHFASAATLLFRSYGIPARYVEGYVITQSAISNRAEATIYNYNYFFEGENILDNSSVVEVEVTDGEAHAWVEVFVDGFGWMPVEVTPPSQDNEETTYGDFLSALTGLFGAENGVTQNNGTDINMDYNGLFSSLRFGNSPIIGVFFLLLLTGLLLPLMATVFHKLRADRKRSNAYRMGSYDICIAYEYQRLHRLLSRKFPKVSLALPENIASLLENIFSAMPKAAPKGFADKKGYTVREIVTLTEKSCFSEKQVSKETADLLIAFYKTAYKNIRGIRAATLNQ